MKSIILLLFKKSTIILCLSFLAFLLLFTNCSKNNNNYSSIATNTNNNLIQFVFTSDQHYGLFKINFQGATNVDAKLVNAALVAKMNTIPTLILPNDGGVQAGKSIGFIDAVISGGDIANREETGIQSATVSWGQFINDYINGMTLKDKKGIKTPMYVVPGNHDVSNTVGYYKSMAPPTDPYSMLSMFNLMNNPPVPKTISSYTYATDKVHSSKDINGVHFMFLNIWPDSMERLWMNSDLQNVSASTPILIFEHSIPDVEARFFTNPNGNHDINSTDKFENLVSETFKDGAKTINDLALIEQKAMVAFLQLHPNIKGMFHGHTNYNQFYNWTGPDNNISLPCFRADSPMKGALSVADETKLSFQLVTIDMATKMMTVRECLWNPNPANPSGPINWGSMINLALN